MSGFLDAAFTSRFVKFGEGSRIREGGNIYWPEKISIGNNVAIEAGYWFNIVPLNDSDGPKIIIGDGCVCGMGLSLSAVNRVELGNYARIGSNVNLSDTDHRYDDVGIPVLAQGVALIDGALVIGEGASIGANSVIAGNRRVGKGSVVLPGSVVVADVPDGCVAAGNPAVIVQVYVPETGEWVEARSATEAEQAIRKRGR